ncbi:hypothetical protein B0H13DRAFT_2336692 [Mycena leptocephala]|nr:hypothetical protein B0H13DRAFT_2336692 [Mycena leptocephala]
MPRAGTAARRRVREGLPPVKPGKRGWVHRTKLPFFEEHKDAYIAAAEIKETGDFYDRISQLYLKKYGYNTDWDEDLEEDQEVADDVDPDEDEDSVPEEEAEECATYFKKLRNKISVWYKAQYGGSVEKKQQKVTFTQEAWLSETEGFKQEVLAAIDKDHKIVLEAYTLATSGDTPTTPEEYNLALNNAVYYLQPFANAIHERFGMNVAIMMCGPIADRGGRIEVRSVHAGMMNGLVPRIWSDFDRAGFDQAQRSLIDFTHKCFSSNSATKRDHCHGQRVKRCDGHGVKRPWRHGGRRRKRGDDENMGGPIDPVDALYLMRNAPGFDPRGDPIFDDPEPEDLLFNLVPPPKNASPPKIGQALADELAQLPQTECESLMARLRDMGEEDLDMENDFARNRLFLRRVNEGMSAMDAITLGAAEEEEEEARAARAASGEEEGGGWWNEKINPPPEQRPKPKPRYRRAADAMGQQLGTSPQLERPEVNRDAEGPVQCEREGPTPTVEREEAPSHPEEEEAPRRPEEAPRRPEEASTTPTPNMPDENQGDGTPLTWLDPDMTGWPDELRKAFRAFERGKAWGGNEWETCVTRLIALEKTWKYAAKGMLSAPNGQEDERPEEIPEFMCLARKWDLPVSLSSGIGPREMEGSFSNQWWRWWGHAQPESRLSKDGEWRAPADLKSEDWSEVAKMHGRNGMLLYLGGLLWWGESAAAVPALLADWKLAVEDVSVVLVAAIECESANPTVKAKETRNAAKSAGGQKRKKPATSSAPDKENSPPKKRLRTRR